mgnify:FL=1
MICPKCGTNNNDTSNFCIKCGSDLKTLNTQNTTPNNIDSSINLANQNLNQQSPVNQSVNNNITGQSPYINNQTINNTVPNHAIKNSQVSFAIFNYLMYFGNVLLKPFKTYKEKESKLSDTKTSIILSLIITVIMTIINLISTVISVVHISKYVYGSGYKYTWQWSNLKNIKWFSVIFKNFLIYAGAIVGIAAIFYIASLIIKKEIKFIKSLSISATCAIPMIAGSMILSPIASKIWTPLGIIFAMSGIIYSFLIFYELINDEIKLEKDTKIYFNLACFITILIIGYFILSKVLLGSISSLF